MRKLFLIPLILSSCAHPGVSREPPHRLDFANFQVFKPDGTELWHYTSFLVYSNDGNTNTTESYLDSQEPGAMLSRTLEMKTKMLPDNRTAVTIGQSMDVAVEGYSRSEDLPEGRKKVILEKNFANWWTNKGETIVEKDGSMTGRMELRNKAGELVSIYLMKSHPATRSERELFEKRRSSAKKAALRPEEVIDYSLNRSRATYPSATTGSSAR